MLGCGFADNTGAGQDACAVLKHWHLSRTPNQSLQPTCYLSDCSNVTEDGELLDGSSRQEENRTRLN